MPYKVSCMFAPASLRSQQVAIITAGGLLAIHTSHSINLKTSNLYIILIRRVLKCDSTQDGYTSSPLLLTVAVHKLLVIVIWLVLFLFSYVHTLYNNVMLVWVVLNWKIMVQFNCISIVCLVKHFISLCMNLEQMVLVQFDYTNMLIHLWCNCVDRMKGKNMRKKFRH